MMEGPYHVPFGKVEPQDGQPPERRLRQIESTVAIEAQKPGEFVLERGLGNGAPILLLPWQRKIRMNLLTGFRKGFPLKVRSQNGMAAHDRAPCTLKGRQIEFFVQVQDQLLDIYSRAWSQQRMKQHSLLQR